MQLFERETFWHSGEPFSFAGAVINQSAFNQCVVRSTRGTWNRFSDLALADVSHWNCSMSGCAFDGVTVHDLKKTGSAPLFIWASVFRRTKLTGNIRGLKINRSDLNPAIGDEARLARDAQVREYYSDVDWAMDISQAEFPAGVTFEAIPGDKIVRNTSKQALIKRENLNARDWRALNFERSAIDIAISWFERDSMFDSVVIAPRSDPKHRAGDLRVIEMLRAEGLAEPD